MSVSEKSPHAFQHDGRWVYFCGPGCKAKFAADPGRYPAATSSDSPADVMSAAPIAGAAYTCPMHPEVRRDRPGSCPKCGMALEPEIPSLDEENPELEDFRRRFFWTVPLTVIVAVLAMAGHRMHWRQNLRGIALTRVISNETIANMKQNLGFAFTARAW